MALLAAGLLLNPHALCAHGRNSTAISADVSPTGAVVTIEAVVIDLLQISGIDVRTWRTMSAAGREPHLRRSIATLVSRFRLFDGTTRVLPATTPRVAMPDFSSPALRQLGLDQQSITITLHYAFAAPPAALTFWQSFDGGRVANPIYAQLTLRRNGEMVMLPAELGAGFLVSFPFDWETDPVPLAHRRNLQSAACGWRNRPATARLEIGRDQVTWTLYMPAEALLADIPAADAGTAWNGLESRLERGLSLAVEGAQAQPAEAVVRVYPLSAHALAHDRRQPPGQWQGALVEIEFSAAVDQLPAGVTALWRLFSESCPVIFSEVLVDNRVVDYSLLTPSNPFQHWSATP